MNIDNSGPTHDAATTPPSAAAATGADASQLGHGLKVRHLTMMGLGSAIGAGIFLGTGVGIKTAGPAVILSYLAAGIIVVMVMRMLGEMAAARPNTGSFAAYADMAFGHWAGFSVGWLYWFLLVMVMGAEITGAGAMMGAWFGIPGWIPALVCVMFFTVVNLAAVRGFGEFEYWFAFIKVAVISAFLIIGVLLIFGLLPGTDFVGARVFLADGFAPNGFGGVAAGLLVVAFAFGGIEIITIAAAESDEPERSITMAVRSVITRILVFYLGAVLVITFLLPYDTLDAAESAAESPFTRVLEMAHLPYIVGFMEFIIVLALLSAFNAQIYGTSRLMYAQAMKGDAPKFLRKTNANGVPIPAVWVSMAFAYFSVFLQVKGPSDLIEILFNAVGGSLLVLWLMIAASQIKLRPLLEKEGKLAVKMWGYPYLSWLTIVALLVLGGLMFADPNARIKVIAVAVLFAVLAVMSLATRNNATRTQEYAVSDKQ